MMYYYGGDNWGGMALSMGFMALLWGALIGAIVWATLRGRREPSRSARRDETPLAILERRYAAGEIDDAEYGRRRTVLFGESAVRPVVPAR